MSLPLPPKPPPCSSLNPLHIAPSLMLMIAVNAFVALPVQALSQMSISSSSDITSTVTSTFISSDSHLPTIAATATTTTTTTTTDALSPQDIGIGILLALLLAFVASFLQGQSTSSFPNFVLWTPSTSSDKNIDNNETVQTKPQEKETMLFTTLTNATNTITANATATNSSKVLFTATDWKEMSRPENYIWYSSPNFKQTGRRKSSKQRTVTNNKKNQMAVVALAAIFLPIFAAELFLALSRQFLCESSSVVFPLGFGDDVIANILPYWAQDWCAPYYRGGGG